MRLHIDQSGTGDPIVFIHGMGSSSATWNDCAPLLAAGHHVVVVDLLGHGRSPVPDDPDEYTRDAALADLDDVLAMLAPSPAVLVGHSLGGYLALAHAATRRGVARGLVVLNTGPGFRDADKREGWNERSRRNAHRFGVPEQVANLNLQFDSVVMERLAELTVPTLAMAGSADRPEYTTSGEYLARKMPHCRFQLIEGGEHAMHEGALAPVIAAHITAFVDGLAPIGV
ncbi:MAG: hypothetical protein JWL72_2486 [Ilumatobacteraceae bacterium]|nr:hypothetical protein [Ilumatobacteraceae bacterium]MCU1389148.1 hypothetical protein [Ilumatobacteraceae bacterium]